MRARRVARQLWRGTMLVGIGLAGGAALVTARHLLMTPQPLDSGLPGDGHIDRRHGGDVYYSVAGPADGQPVVLLHGFYPGASSFEFRSVFARLAETYRVYAPDWLGFGMSERPALTHTGEFYAATLTGFLRDVVGAPASVVAIGLAGNIATRVASDAPELIDRLTLVAPESEAGMRLDPTLGQTVARLMQKVALGMTPYAIVSLRPALRLAAGRRSAVGPLEVDEETLDHLYASAHQFGGEHATLSLLTGELDLPMRQVFPLLQTPTLLMIGARDSRHSLYEMERLVTLNPHADLEVISNAGETVYLDQPTLFMHTFHRWMSRRIARREPAREQPPIAAAAPVGAPAALVAPAAKIVSVLEPSSAPAAAAPQEVHVTRAPDGETLASATDAADVAQPLTLEPTGEPPAGGAPGATPMARAATSSATPPSGPSVHDAGIDLQQADGRRTAPTSTGQSHMAYHVAPATGARAPRRAPRRRHAH